MQITLFLFKFTQNHAPDPCYMTILPGISGQVYHNTSLLHIERSICTWYTDTPWLCAISWSCTQPHEPWKLCKWHQMRHQTHGIWWADGNYGYCKWHSVVQHTWGTYGLAYKHVAWRYTMDIHRILITHTLTCAIYIWRIHVQTHCLRLVEGGCALCKWPNMIQYEYVTCDKPHGRVMWRYSKDTRRIWIIQTFMFAMKSKQIHVQTLDRWCQTAFYTQCKQPNVVRNSFLTYGKLYVHVRWKYTMDTRRILVTWLLTYMQVACSNALVMLHGAWWSPLYVVLIGPACPNHIWCALRTRGVHVSYG